MQSRFQARRSPYVLILAIATLSISAARLSAQTDLRIPGKSVASDNTSAIESILEDGRKLELEERWADAFTHFDDATHEYPDSQKLKLRRTLAHIHVDLARRAADSSFVNFQDTATRQEALGTFQEICLKVQSHYVTEPDWQRLTWRGTASLDVAITKPDFRKRFVPQITDAQITSFRHLLRNSVNKRTIGSRNEARDLVAQTARLAKQHLGVPENVSIGEYCAGAVASLDQYSTYLTPDQLDDVYNQIEGSFVGLGIELKATNDHLLIMKVIPNGPADRAGVMAGDHITAVNGKPTKDVSTDKAADMLKGEQGTYVDVTILRGDSLRSLQVRRERVDVPGVEDIGIIDQENKIGYFRLTSFQKTTSRDVDRALWQLHREGMQSLIIDVRGNPGGLLPASVEVADKFVQEGTIVSTRGRSPREDFDYKAHRVGTWRVPLIVLIDRDTASASEIFAGAIHDHARGTVVGERSYGKGSVQGIFPLSISRSGVRLTTAKFYSPSGRAISDNGVKPHRTVHVMAKPTGEQVMPGGIPTEEKDPVVAAACQVARQLVVAANR